MLNTEKFAELFGKNLAEKTGEEVTKKAAREHVDVFLDSLIEAVKDHDGVDFARYFGVEVEKTEARTVKNPRFYKDPTVSEFVDVPAGKKASFKRNKLLKDALK